jgi:hypothetical protein
MIEMRRPEEIAAVLLDAHKYALSGIIAIDGRDGAGKDCLALNLQKLAGGGIVSLDIFIKQKNQGGYVSYLDVPRIREAIEECATPKIIAGCCMLQVLAATGHKEDLLIYAKRVMFYPDRFNYNWLDDEVLHSQKAVSDEDTVTKEIIQYHERFEPLKKAAIAFLHTYEKYRCPFHLDEN